MLLLTEDLNLTNKAVVMGIKCFSTKVTEIYFIASTHLCAVVFCMSYFLNLFSSSFLQRNRERWTKMQTGKGTHTCTHTRTRAHTHTHTHTQTTTTDKGTCKQEKGTRKRNRKREHTDRNRNRKREDAGDMNKQKKGTQTHTPHTHSPPSNSLHPHLKRKGTHG